MSLFRTKNIDAMLAAAQDDGLKKVLGPIDLVMMGIGAIVGTGIFVLTGTGALTAGPALTVSFLIAATACGFAALCYAEFASAIPVSGSIYTYSYATLGAIVGMTSVILVMTYGQTRIIFAMSRDGLLPERLSSVHPVHATPYFATWTVGIVFASIAAFVPLNVLAELINIGTLAAFTLVSIAVLVLRRTRPDLPRAFRCPGGPLVPVLSIAFCVFLMAYLQPLTWLAFIAWMALGLAIYFLYARRNAVLHNHGG